MKTIYLLLFSMTLASQGAGAIRSVTSTPNGPIYFDNTHHGTITLGNGLDRRVILRTDDDTNVTAVTIGANLSFDGTTLSATGGSGDAGGTNARQGGTLTLTNLSGNPIPFTNVIVAGSGVTLSTNTGVVTVSSSGGGPTIARASADVVVTNSSFVNATNLSFAVAATTNYRFRFVVHYTTAATTTGIRFGINGPAAQTALRVGGILPTGTGAMNAGSQTAYDTAIFAATTGPGGTAVCGVIEGVFRNGNNSGTLALRVASETGSAVTILTDSHGELQSF